MINAGIVLFIARIVAVLGSLGIAFIITNYYGFEEFGKYSVFINFVQITTSIIAFGMPTLYIKELKLQERRNVKSKIGVVLLSLFLAALLVVNIFYESFLSQLYGGILGKSDYIMGTLASLSMATILVFNETNRARSRFFRYGILGNPLLYVLMLILFCVQINIGLDGYIIASYLFASFLSVCVFYLASEKSLAGKVILPDLIFLRECSVYFLSNIVYLFFLSLPLFVVSNQFDESIVGRFSLAEKIAQIQGVLLLVVSSLVIPKILDRVKNKDRSVKLFLQKMWVVLLVASIVSYLTIRFIGVQYAHHYVENGILFLDLMTPLLLAQSINLAFGPVGTILQVIGEGGYFIKLMTIISIPYSVLLYCFSNIALQAICWVIPGVVLLWNAIMVSRLLIVLKSRESSLVI